MLIVVKGNRITIVGINTGGGNDGASKISADIFTDGYEGECVTKQPSANYVGQMGYSVPTPLAEVVIDPATTGWVKNIEKPYRIPGAGAIKAVAL